MKIKISIPTSLNEITLEQYQRFISIAEKNEDNNFLQLKMLEIFCGVSLEIASNMSLKDVNEITASINEMFAKEYKLQTIFKLADTNFGFIPNLDEISLGEFTDLDNYFGKMDKMHNAMAVLYRPIIDKFKNKYTIQDYNGSITYCDVMKSMPMDVVFGAMVFFLQFKQRIINQFPELFGSESTGESFNRQAQFGAKWGWFSSYYSLSQGNAGRFNEVSKLRLVFALTFLTFEKEKIEIEQSMLKKNE